MGKIIAATLLVWLGGAGLGAGLSVYARWIDAEMPAELFAVQRADGSIYLPPGYYTPGNRAFAAWAGMKTILDMEHP